MPMQDEVIERGEKGKQVQGFSCGPLGAELAFLQRREESGKATVDGYMAGMGTVSESSLSLAPGHSLLVPDSGRRSR